MSDEQDKNTSNAWVEYKRLVLMELERLNEQNEGIRAKLSDIDKQISDGLKKLDSEGVDRVHKLDIRLNIIETKALLIAAVCSFAVGGIIQLVIKMIGH